ncbi:MAG: hypothetical protein LBM63_03050 [Rikenellaceae bacterium]|jgi:hypothetical protein|nr:hypothetical protein [Rikenellaceae bacterium]
MKTLHIFKHTAIALFGLVTTVGCTLRDIVEPAKLEGVISLSVRSATARINSDMVTWEDRVDEVRMIVFNQDGMAVYNSMLRFPNGMNQLCTPVRIMAGTYDFHFVANETASSDELSEALATLSNKSDLVGNPVFQKLSWNENFQPSRSSSSGRIVMSAQYDDIEVVRGGTANNPTLLQLESERVELVRAMSKVQVVFRKKQSGSSVRSGIISSVGLANVSQYMSLFAADDYSANTRTASTPLTPAGLDYTRDSIGAVTWYIPEQLNRDGETAYTKLLINDQSFAVSAVAPHNIERNSLYRINAYITPQGGIELDVCVEDWNRFEYKYMFQEENRTIAIPPVIPTDSSVIVPTACGTVEILSHTEVLPQGLMGAFGDKVNWYDPAVGGPSITKGEEPYYCEKKYGPGWRLINSCEIMSFLRVFDQAYRVWQGNTWMGSNNGLQHQSLPFRQEAQVLLGKLTGYDMSRFTPQEGDNNDTFGGEKLGMIDQFFTPGDIVVRESDYAAGSWPYAGKPNNNGQKWFPMEVSIQVKAYWYSDYIDINKDENLDKILYLNFATYDYSSTVSRCVRTIE